MRKKNKALHFIVGYSGSCALVDRKLLKKMGKASAEEFLAEGLFLQACRKALAEGNTSVLKSLGQRLHLNCSENEIRVQLSRVFGITGKLSGISSLVYI